MRLWLRWPTLAAALAFVLNVDLVIMPALTMLGVAGVWLALGGAAACTAEFGVWYWYSGWLGRNLTKTDAGKRLRRQFHYAGLLRQAEESYYNAVDTLSEIRDWLIDHVQEHADLHSPAKQRFLDGSLGILKSSPTWMTYPLMFGLGCFPLGWAVAILIHRLRPVPWAMTVFMVANALKAVLLGFVYLWLPLWAKVAIWAAIIGFVVWQFRKRTRRNGTGSL